MGKNYIMLILHINFEVNFLKMNNLCFSNLDLVIKEELDNFKEMKGD